MSECKNGGYAVPRDSRGTVLVYVMLLMLMIQLLMATVLGSATTQVRISGNSERQLKAELAAEGIATLIFESADSFPIDLPAGAALCLPGDGSDLCSGDFLSTAVDTVWAEDYEVTARVIRSLPYALAMTRAGGMASDFARYELMVEVSGRNPRLGNAKIVMGVLLDIESGSRYIASWRNPEINVL